jgi:tRNA(His) 5'-end guanylyltransferase
MDFSARMKKYERASDFYLTDRLPIILRIDGKAFHSYTRGLSKKSTGIAEAMDHAATVLCKQISGARLAYIQSDEISVLVNPWVERESQAWFDNCLQKIVSVTASICAAEVTARSVEIFGKVKPAYFDSRAFILPFEEVNSYFVWRQQDATRNSIQVLGQMHFSAKELHKKSCNDIQEMLFTQRGINWNDEPVRFKRGGCIIKVDTEVPTKEGGTIVRPKWVNDFRIPVFSQNKDYVESRVRPLPKVIVEEEKV